MTHHLKCGIHINFLDGLSRRYARKLAQQTPRLPPPINWTTLFGV